MAVLDAESCASVDECAVAADECAVNFDEPFLVQQWRCEARCWARGSEFRRRLFARQARNTLKKLPDSLISFIIVSHLLAWPVAMQGLNLIQPTARVLEVNRAGRDMRASTLENVWSLVEGMHYGGDHKEWDESLDTLDAPSARKAMRSESAFSSMTTGLIGALNDPCAHMHATDPVVHALYRVHWYWSLTCCVSSLCLRTDSAYASAQDLAQQPVSSGFGLSLRPGPLVEDWCGGRDGVGVWGVVPDSAAEAAGLRTGDVVLQIAGVESPLGTLSPVELSSYLRNPGVLRLQVLRQPNDRQPSDRRLARGAPEWLTIDGRQTAQSDVSLSPSPEGPPAMPVSAVRAKLLRGRVGYVRIKAFTEAGTSQLAEEISKLSGAGSIGWVLDLRNCPGGQLTEALAQASLLLASQDATLAYTVDAAGFFDAHTVGTVERNAAGLGGLQTASSTQAVERPQASQAQSSAAPVQPAQPAQLHAPLVPEAHPVVVLINRGTASSAELFAAALRDNGRGTLIGEHSFGKGLIQRVFPLPDGGALKLTIGEYMRPNKARVEPGVGLQPDVMCAATPHTGGAADESDECVNMAASLVRRSRDQPQPPDQGELALLR